MGLEHNFLYISSDKYSDDIWKKIQWHPLCLENEFVSEPDYVGIHDDLLRYFHDYFVWIKLYNPAKKEYVNGFCYYGVTKIHDDALLQMKNIIDGLLTIFTNAPDMINLKGNYIFEIDDDGKIDDKKSYYDKIYVEKDKIISIFKKLITLIEKAVENGDYILHLGI
jgi:hypothetical protein